MPFAICNEIYQGWTLEETCRHAAATGYGGLELAPFTLAPLITQVSRAERQRIGDTIRSSGLEVVGLHWLLARTEGFHISHPEAAVRGKTGRYLEELVTACHEIGGRILVFGSPQQRSVLPGVSPEQAWAWATEVFRGPVQRAAALGLTICFEPLAPAETNFLNTAADTLRFARQFDSPGARIMLDVKAMSSEAQPIPSIIRESAGAFAHFHANDPNMKGPGFGQLDFRPIADALREVEFSGWVSVEVFKFEEGAEAIAEGSLATLRAAFATA